MTVKFLWSDDYNVGHDLLDKQHKYLFELGNSIQNADPKEARRYVMELYKYISAHFTREEQHMKSIGFPELERHRCLHEQLITELNTLSHGFTPESLDVLISFLHEWLVHHVLQEDKKYFRFARK